MSREIVSSRTCAHSDTMRTEALTALLRADSMADDGEDVDTDVLIYIVEVLRTQ